MSTDAWQLIFTSGADEIGDESLSLRSVKGRQSLSRLYEYEVELVSEADGGLSSDDIESLLSNTCRVEVGQTADVAPFELNGVLRRIELLPMTEESVAVYRALIVPTLFRTTLSFGSRIFQGASWPAIVSQVLEEHGVLHELQLDGSYPEREYTVQHEETDFDFVSRLMEHWGIYYFFEQAPDGEKMVIADSARVVLAHPDHETINYVVHVAGGETADAGGISSLSRTHEIRPSKMDLKDYNWRHPQVIPEGEYAADEATGHGTLHVYGEHIKDPQEGVQLAQIRAEQLLVDREVYRGHTGLLGLMPGHKFLLSGYPTGDLDQDYVITSFEDDIGHGGVANRSFSAVPLTVALRTRRVTRKPRVIGTSHAHVDGAVEGAAAPLDELGRYKLVFPFDRLAEAGGRASRWVRMAQSSTGSNYGMHLPLHIGCEVAIMHVGGDPDRPLIIGAVPNAETISPVTQADATKSRIRTKGGILMEMEDAGE